MENEDLERIKKKRDEIYDVWNKLNSDRSLLLKNLSPNISERKSEIEREKLFETKELNFKIKEMTKVRADANKAFLERLRDFKRELDKEKNKDNLDFLKKIQALKRQRPVINEKFRQQIDSITKERKKVIANNEKLQNNLAERREVWSDYNEASSEYHKFMSELGNKYHGLQQW